MSNCENVHTTSENSITRTTREKSIVHDFEQDNVMVLFLVVLFGNVCYVGHVVA